MHKHTCQICNKEWDCNNESPQPYDTDEDCRWYVYVVCPDCFITKRWEKKAKEEHIKKLEAICSHLNLALQHLTDNTYELQYWAIKTLQSKFEKIISDLKKSD